MQTKITIEIVRDERGFSVTSKRADLEGETATWTRSHGREELSAMIGRHIPEAFVSEPVADTESRVEDLAEGWRRWCRNESEELCTNADQLAGFKFADEENSSNLERPNLAESYTLIASDLPKDHS